tara:strand:+ start:5838 stop:6395 length:558 start_codon:yes stop_codon:yes gene_type:complete
MTFEEKIIKNSKLRQRKLMRAVRIASEKPDTGVKILKKGAYFLIKDSADISVKYLSHLCYGSYSDPIRELKGKFTQAEIIDFVGRSKEDIETRQLLHIVLTDIGTAQFKLASGDTEPIPVSTVSEDEPELDFTFSEDEDVYGDYDNEDDDEPVQKSSASEPVDEEVDVDDVTGVINKLIEVFAAK